MRMVLSFEVKRHRHQLAQYLKYLLPEGKWLENHSYQVSIVMMFHGPSNYIVLVKCGKSSHVIIEMTLQDFSIYMIIFYKQSIHQIPAKIQHGHRYLMTRCTWSFSTNNLYIKYLQKYNMDTDILWQGLHSCSVNK
mgnify:CR=1 FL=1